MPKNSRGLCPRTPANALGAPSALGAPPPDPNHQLFKTPKTPPFLRADLENSRGFSAPNSPDRESPYGIWVIFIDFFCNKKFWSFLIADKKIFFRSWEFFSDKVEMQKITVFSKIIFSELSEHGIRAKKTNPKKITSRETSPQEIESPVLRPAS